MARFALRLLNGIYEFVIGTLILSAAIFAGYSIWDNSQIYRSAEYVQEQIRQLKSDEASDKSVDFEALKAINSDVIAWLTVDDTNIDYPVLQGDTNLTYMNQDIYGEFSLAGSIFLDIRNKPDFSDNYSLIYGHNMDEHLMFGDLALFKDKDFFLTHTDASIILPDAVNDMKVAAVLQISAGTEEIFNPDMWQNSLDGFGEFLKNNSIWYHSDLIEKLIKDPDSVQIVGLATCSGGSTNDRTVLILIKDKPKEEISGSDSKTGTDEDDGDKSDTDDVTPGGTVAKPTGDNQNKKLWILLIAGAIGCIAVFEIIDRFMKRNRQ